MHHLIGCMPNEAKAHCEGHGVGDLEGCMHVLLVAHCCMMQELSVHGWAGAAEGCVHSMP
jgi:hypothetical protein